MLFYTSVFFKWQLGLEMDFSYNLVTSPFCGFIKIKSSDEQGNEIQTFFNVYSVSNRSVQPHCTIPQIKREDDRITRYKELWFHPFSSVLAALLLCHTTFLHAEMSQPVLLKGRRFLTICVCDCRDLQGRLLLSFQAGGKRAGGPPSTTTRHLSDANEQPLTQCTTVVHKRWPNTWLAVSWPGWSSVHPNSKCVSEKEGETLPASPNKDYFYRSR